MGQLGPMPGRGGLHSGSERIGDLRQVRVADPVVQPHVPVERLGRLFRGGGLCAGRGPVPAVRPVRPGDPAVQRDVPVGCVDRLQRPGDLHPGRQSVAAVRQLRHPDPQLQQQLHVEQLGRLRWAGRVPAGGERGLRRVRLANVQSGLSVGSMHRRRRVPAGAADHDGMPDLPGQRMHQQLHVVGPVQSVRGLQHVHPVRHGLPVRLSRDRLRLQFPVRRQLLEQQSEHLRPELRRQFQQVRHGLPLGLPCDELWLQLPVRRQLLEQQPDHLPG